MSYVKRSLVLCAACQANEAIRLKPIQGTGGFHSSDTFGIGYREIEFRVGASFASSSNVVPMVPGTATAGEQIGSRPPRQVNFVKPPRTPIVQVVPRRSRQVEVVRGSRSQRFVVEGRRRHRLAATSDGHAGRMN